MNNNNACNIGCFIRQSRQLCEAIINGATSTLDSDIEDIYKDILKVAALTRAEHPKKFDAWILLMHRELTKQPETPERILLKQFEELLTYSCTGKGWTDIINLTNIIFLCNEVANRYHMQHNQFNKIDFQNEQLKIAHQFITGNLRTIIEELGGWPDFREYAAHFIYSRACKAFETERCGNGVITGSDKVVIAGIGFMLGVLLTSSLGSLKS